jgi:hypothetical protein
MTLLAGRIKTVFDKMKYLWNRISQRFEGNLAKSEDVVDFSELDRTRRKLVQMRSRTEGSESTGAFAMEAVRRRMTSEVDLVDVSAVRSKNRQAVNKWFNREDATETGSFNAVDFDRRLKEVHYDTDENPIGALPAVEDSFMAFSRQDDNLFYEESASLSGIHFKVDPLDDLDDTSARRPALPMFGPKEEIDFAPTTSFAPEELEVDETVEAVRITSSNPMLQVLDELEERMGANAARRDAYWVGD